MKFNAHGPDGLIDRKPPGRPSKLTDAHRAALVARVDAGPIPAVHGVVRFGWLRSLDRPPRDDRALAKPLAWP